MCRSTAGPNWLPFSFGGKSLERTIWQRLDGVLSRRVHSQGNMVQPSEQAYCTVVQLLIWRLEATPVQSCDTHGIMSAGIHTAMGVLHRLHVL